MITIWICQNHWFINEWRFVFLQIRLDIEPRALGVIWPSSREKQEFRAQQEIWTEKKNARTCNNKLQILNFVKSWESTAHPRIKDDWKMGILNPNVLYMDLLLILCHNNCIFVLNWVVCVCAQKLTKLKFAPDLCFNSSIIRDISEQGPRKVCGALKIIER